MKLEGKPEYQQAIVDDSEDSAVYQNLKCDVLIKSIGYKSLAMPGVPFDKQKNIIPNQFGCVLNPETNTLEAGLYCAGWVKRGPVGIIDATLRDTMDTFKIIKHHLENDILPGKQTTTKDVMALLEGGPDIVTLDKWAKIKEHEISAGRAHGKLKEKILSKSKMIEVANSQ